MRSTRTTVGGLATHVWRPDGPSRAVLVARTPYGAAGHAAEAGGWASYGVALVVQDVRGRHGSPGDFRPYTEDASTDGPALLAWVRTWADAPVVLLGTSYGAHAALATATALAPDGVVVAVPALGLGETARTRGGVLQLGSRLGWWLTHGVRTPWHDVVTARRNDATRAAAVARLTCPLLAIAGTDDYFAHDTLDLWAAWGGPARLAIGPWDHGLAGARRATRVLAWLDDLLAGSPPTGAETITRDGSVVPEPPGLAVVHVDAAPDEQWCASVVVGDREVARGAALGGSVPLGPVLADDLESTALDVRLSTDDFPRFARAPHPSRPVPSHSLELIA